MSANGRGAGPVPGPSLRATVLVVAGLAALIAAAVVAGWYLTNAWLRPGEQVARRLPPEPRLQRVPIADLTRLREREERLLTSYGWVDREAGVVRIPVERAMQLVAERGLDGAEGEDRAAAEAQRAGAITHLESEPIPTPEPPAAKGIAEQGPQDYPALGGPRPPEGVERP